MVLETNAVLRVQTAWRAKKGRFAAFLLRRARAEHNAACEAAALRMQTIFRGHKGRKRANAERANRTLAQLKLQDLFAWAAITIQRHWRGFVRAAAWRRGAGRAYAVCSSPPPGFVRGSVSSRSTCLSPLAQWDRRIAAERRTAYERRWKEMWDDETQRPFYYDKNTGEIRWRRPQHLLNQLPKPVCDNCEVCVPADSPPGSGFVPALPGGREPLTAVLAAGPFPLGAWQEAIALFECRDCQEFFCVTCWPQIHFGGKRKQHYYRPLYDAYDHRIDYGDGEWPSVWPSEIHQDEHVGWTLASEPPTDIKTTWDATGGVVSPPPKRKAGIIQVAPKDIVERGENQWVKYMDDSGWPAYYNESTGENTYDRPAMYETPRYAGQELVETGDGGWTKHWDDANSAEFYYNSVRRRGRHALPIPHRGRALLHTRVRVRSVWPSRVGLDGRSPAKRPGNAPTHTRRRGTTARRPKKLVRAAGPSTGMTPTSVTFTTMRWVDRKAAVGGSRVAPAVLLCVCVATRV